MSSLAAARADNFYFPPEWRPEFGGLSKFNGSKGANQYEQLGMIRFEMPMDSWCLGCNVHMSKGLRFNAKKDKAGKYFSTQIWSFTMKCYSCQGSFIIETDPQNRTYKFVEGIRQHEQDFIPDVDDSLIQSVDESTRQLLTNDPMFRLQHENEDIIKVQTESERLSSLSAIRHNNFKQDYDMNSILRNKNRKRKNH
jgi:coiled-coil domain-containing protein 130